MANAALMITNMADAARVGASSQEQTLPVTNLLTPHVEEHWRSKTNDDFFVFDKQDASPADTFALFGLVESGSAYTRLNLAARLRLSAADSTGELGELGDFSFTNGDGCLDVEYGALVKPLAAPAAWRYARVNLTDADAPNVEAGFVAAGLRESFTYNFVPGAGVITVDRARLGTSAGGQTLAWPDNKFRRVDFNLEWVTRAQRYGVLERMSRANGNHKPLLLMLDTASDNLARDSIWGRVTDATPDTYSTAIDMFGRQIRIDEVL